MPFTGIEENFSRTGFDSHANTPVLGSEAFIIAEMGKQATVHLDNPDYNPKLPAIVDFAVLYECPYGGERPMLVIRNALSVSSMKHNLIPPSWRNS